MSERISLALFERGLRFSGQPREIEALRRALGWSRQSLGRHLGIYVNRRDCYTIYRWEKGMSRPNGALRGKLLELVIRARVEYLAALGEEAGRPAKPPVRS